MPDIVNCPHTYVADIDLDDIRPIQCVSQGGKFSLIDSIHPFDVFTICVLGAWLVWDPMQFYAHIGP